MTLAVSEEVLSQFKYFAGTNNIRFMSLVTFKAVSAQCQDIFVRSCVRRQIKVQISQIVFILFL